ncbi:MAG: hypothetical protein ACYTG0_03450 [Planctomycetota bacterium]|jgi:hypothetical protein
MKGHSILVVAWFLLTSHALLASEMRRADSVLLNGDWLASLDLFDANYLTGQQVTTDLYLINDSWHDATIHVDLMLTRECPEFIPEAECFRKAAGHVEL